ncbi:MAG TPA: ferritin-like domain-containing protein [Candidatus Methylacidiphilales bacterium]|nr:ferritin-like domain-containing protein [Candidatus Methylacidiphilales bacterium]
MNTSSWRHYYESNRLHRTEPPWSAPCQLPFGLRQILAVSLSHFQLGETGGGSFLLRGAAGETDADDLAALALFVAEEQEHARLLARMVERLGGSLVRRHWTHRLFKFARRAGGFRFEIQMLLTAEIVGTAYYDLLKKNVDDPALQAALGLMLRDEAGHITFHLDRLRLRWKTYLPLERSLWALQFQTLLLTALRVAWLDHGNCLRALRCGWLDFAGQARQVAIQFLDDLESPATSCRGCPIPKPVAETIPA